MNISLYFQDVEKYLADRGNDMSIFKCKKVVMVQWLHSVIPYVDLECEVLGDVSGVTWSVNGTLIDTCEYYTHLIFIFLKFDFKYGPHTVTKLFLGVFSRLLIH